MELLYGGLVLIERRFRADPYKTYMEVSWGSFLWGSSYVLFGVHLEALGPLILGKSHIDRTGV